MNFEIRNKFFSNRNVKTWNKLPNNIKDASHLKLFKSLYEKTWMEMWIIINKNSANLLLKVPRSHKINKQTYHALGYQFILYWLQGKARPFSEAMYPR